MTKYMAIIDHNGRFGELEAAKVYDVEDHDPVRQAAIAEGYLVPVEEGYAALRALAKDRGANVEGDVVQIQSVPADHGEDVVAMPSIGGTSGQEPDLTGSEANAGPPVVLDGAVEGPEEGPQSPASASSEGSAVDPWADAGSESPDAGGEKGQLEAREDAVSGPQSGSEAVSEPFEDPDTDTDEVDED